MSKKVFIDGGFHLGEGLSEFKGILGITNEWDIHVFEPNIHCNQNLINDDNITYHNKAIWIENGSQLFNCENNDSTNSPKINSTSKLDGWASCLSLLNSKIKFEDQIKVETIDFSEFINNFEGSEIYCKLDIEGSEYEVLKRLINTGSISLIKEIWVEFHERYLPHESQKTTIDLINQVSKYTKINEWK